MQKWLTWILALILFAAIHEGMHALLATACGEYEAFHVRPYGLEVTYKTPVEERQGVEWGFIAGSSNIVTLILGYLLLPFKSWFAQHSKAFVRQLAFYSITFLLLLDSINLSIIPFIFGGDIQGIVVGFGVPQFVVQIVGFVVFLFNRELLVREVLPAFSVKTSHPLLRPWKMGKV
jgi:hypothetical protein